jgi:hypothetical protein
MIRIRASSLGKIMTEPKNKSEVLSEGAKTFLEDMAKEFVYGYHKVVSSKEMEKGLLVEDESIELYNSVFFCDLKKNTERRNNDWITGECDVLHGPKIVDIKSSWSLATFPATSAAGIDKDYEWQGRAYMMLWDLDQFENAYCLVNTPDELIGYEAQDLHYVDHIQPELRVTITPYKRDKDKEDMIKRKVDHAHQYLEYLVKTIRQEHGL